MKPPDIGTARRAAMAARKCSAAHRPDLMQQLVVSFLRGTNRVGFIPAEQPEPKVK